MESGGTPRTTGWRLSMPGQAPNASRPIKTHMPPLEMIIINVSPASSKVEGDTTDPQTLPSVAEQLHEGALGAWYSLQSALPDDFVADNADSASNTTKKRKPRADLAKVSDTISLIENRIRAHQRGSLLSTSSSEKSTPCDAVSIGYINCVKRHNSAGECLDHKRELMSCREQIGLANPSGVADDSFEAQRSARQVSQKQYYNRDEDQNKNKNKNKNIIKNDLPAGFSFRACSTAGGGCPSGGGTPDGAIAEKLGVPARPTMMQPTPLGPDVSDAGGTLMMSVVQIVLGTGINTLIKKFALYSRKKVNPMLQLSLIDGIPSMGNMEASAKPNGPTGTTKSLPSFGDLPFGDLKRLKPGETPADATPGPAAAGLAAPAVGGGAGQPSYGMAPQPDPPAAGKAPSKPPTATAAKATAAATLALASAGKELAQANVAAKDSKQNAAISVGAAKLASSKAAAAPPGSDEGTVLAAEAAVLTGTAEKAAVSAAEAADAADAASKNMDLKAAELSTAKKEEHKVEEIEREREVLAAKKLGGRQQTGDGGAGVGTAALGASDALGSLSGGGTQGAGSLPPGGGSSGAGLPSEGGMSLPGVGRGSLPGGGSSASDLSARDLSEAGLSGGELSGSDLSREGLSGTDLPGGGSNGGDGFPVSPADAGGGGGAAPGVEKSGSASTIPTGLPSQDSPPEGVPSSTTAGSSFPATTNTIQKKNSASESAGKYAGNKANDNAGNALTSDASTRLQSGGGNPTTAGDVTGAAGLRTVSPHDTGAAKKSKNNLDINNVDSRNKGDLDEKTGTHVGADVAVQDQTSGNAKSFEADGRDADSNGNSETRRDTGGATPETAPCIITLQNRRAASAHVKSESILAGVSESLAQSLREEVAFLTTKTGKENRRRAESGLKKNGDDDAIKAETLLGEEDGNNEQDTLCPSDVVAWDHVHQLIKDAKYTSYVISQEAARTLEVLQVGKDCTPQSPHPSLAFASSFFETTAPPETITSRRDILELNGTSGQDPDATSKKSAKAWAEAESARSLVHSTITHCIWTVDTPPVRFSNASFMPVRAHKTITDTMHIFRMTRKAILRAQTRCATVPSVLAPEITDVMRKLSQAGIDGDIACKAMLEFDVHEAHRLWQKALEAKNISGAAESSFDYLSAKRASNNYEESLKAADASIAFDKQSDLHAKHAYREKGYDSADLYENRNLFHDQHNSGASISMATVPLWKNKIRTSVGNSQPSSAPAQKSAGDYKTKDTGKQEGHVGKKHEDEPRPDSSTPGKVFDRVDPCIGDGKLDGGTPCVHRLNQGTGEAPDLIREYKYRPGVARAAKLLRFLQVSASTSSGAREVLRMQNFQERQALIRRGRRSRRLWKRRRKQTVIDSALVQLHEVATSYARTGVGAQKTAAKKGLGSLVKIITNDLVHVFTALFTKVSTRVEFFSCPFLKYS